MHPQTEPTVSSTHQLELGRVVLDRWVGDRLEHRAFASRARVDRLANTTELENVQIDVLEPETRTRSARVTAPRGQGDLGAQLFTLEGGVRVVDDEGRVLETEQGTYDAKARTVVAPGAVSLTGDNFQAEGASATLDLAEDILTIAGPIRSEVRPMDDRSDRGRSAPAEP